MHRYFITLTLSTIGLVQTPVLAWNNYGHMTVAYIAYQKLTPQARAKANALLTKNPDFPNWLAMVPAGTSAADKNLMLFMIAATWPDRIKRAAGYNEDNPSDPNKPDGPISFQNIGFTDHYRHRCWHFIDVAFTQDNTSPLPATPVPNAKERIELFRPALGSNDDDLKSYDLSWLLHLVGDVHQPLHCATRVGLTQPDGDAGGNKVTLDQGTSIVKLHAFWDDILGPRFACPFHIWT